MIALRTLICRLHKLQINSRIVVALCSMRNSGEAFSRLRASFRMNLAPSRSQMLSLKKPDRAKLVLIISRVRQRGSPSLNMKPHHRRYTRCQHHRQSKACCQKFSSQLAPWNISCFLRISFCPRPKNLPIRYFHWKGCHQISRIAVARAKIFSTRLSHHRITSNNCWIVLARNSLAEHNSNSSHTSLKERPLIMPHLLLWVLIRFHLSMDIIIHSKWLIHRLAISKL